MTLSNNIRFLRKKKGWSQEYIAEQLGYKSFTTIQKWETGIAEPPIKKLQELSALFNVDINDIANTDLENPVNINSSLSSGVSIPVLGSIPAGVPIEAIEDIIDWEEIPKQMTSGGREYFALKVKGDSMYPKYLEGDTIIVRKECDCESGQDCVVYVNGYDATLKKVIKNVDHIILQPLNSNYEPKMFEYNDEKNPIRIAGVVVEIRRKV